jgi:protein-S-isoprenylcysteine O-methyltransferase Ste14
VAWATPPGGWASAAATLARRTLPTLTSSPTAAAGLALFAAGSAVQAWAHLALARLQATAAAQGKPYALPTSGILAAVACPHYSGEIALYAGLALLTLCALRPLPWLVLAWVACNLVLGAADADAWYRKAFGRAYPRGRARLVPGVW